MWMPVPSRIWIASLCVGPPPWLGSDAKYAWSWMYEHSSVVFEPAFSPSTPPWMFRRRPTKWSPQIPSTVADGADHRDLDVLDQDVGARIDADDAGVLVVRRRVTAHNRARHAHVAGGDDQEAVDVLRVDRGAVLGHRHVAVDGRRQEARRYAGVRGGRLDPDARRRRRRPCPPLPRRARGGPRRRPCRPSCRPPAPPVPVVPALPTAPPVPPPPSGAAAPPPHATAPAAPKARMTNARIASGRMAAGRYPPTNTNG